MGECQRRAGWVAGWTATWVTPRGLARDRLRDRAGGRDGRRRATSRGFPRPETGPADGRGLRASRATPSGSGRAFVFRPGVGAPEIVQIRVGRRRNAVGDGRPEWRMCPAASRRGHLREPRGGATSVMPSAREPHWDHSPSCEEGVARHATTRIPPAAAAAARRRPRNGAVLRTPCERSPDRLATTGLRDASAMTLRMSRPEEAKSVRTRRVDVVAGGGCDRSAGGGRMHGGMPSARRSGFRWGAGVVGPDGGVGPNLAPRRPFDPPEG